MVRSKGEDRPDFFHLVEQIRAEDKYFNVSRLEMANKLAKDEYVQIECDHVTTSEGGPVELPLKLCFAVRRKYWSVALLLYDTRIDGIDWQSIYPCEDGSDGRGWHRHEWNADDLKARIHVPLPATFEDGLKNVHDFLVRVSKEMRITWNANDVGFTDELPLD